MTKWQSLQRALGSKDAKLLAPTSAAQDDLQTENAELRRQLEVFRSPVRCKYVEDDGGRAAAGYGEPEGDCVARAITIATGKPYAEVFEALKAAHGPLCEAPPPRQLCCRP